MNKSDMKKCVFLGVTVTALAVATSIKAVRSGSTSHTCNRNYVQVSLHALLEMPPDRLAEQDIAAVNLACAARLRGAEELDVEACLDQLDLWANQASRIMDEREYLFHRDPSRYDYSINRWRCAGLVQYLNQVVGLRYNSRSKERNLCGPYDTSFYADSRDFLIHGLISGKDRGSCASIPVVFAAVARRLGYPMKLVMTRNHLFARWCDPNAEETFNIEVTDQYAEFKNDDFYRSFPAALNPGEENRQGYLVPLTPQRELSAFLHLRAMCLWDMKRLVDARNTFIASIKLDPVYKVPPTNNHFILELDRQIQKRSIQRGRKP